MGFIPEHKIDQIRDAANIVEVVSNYVNLKAAGNLYRGLCPFHSEKTPSFTVNPEKRIFHCFGCGVGGNVFRYLMLQKGISFVEALMELAERYNIEVTPDGDSSEYRYNKNLKSDIYQVMSLAMDFFHQTLLQPDGRQAREYLSGRGLPLEIIKEFKLGWAPPGWDNLYRHLSGRQISREVMDKAGLVRTKGDGQGRYDTFRARVITPIFDQDARPVAFGGRLLLEDSKQPKYLNSPETPVFSKGRLLYGFGKNKAALKDAKRALIVEGYFDLLSLASHGIHHVVATLGTALTAHHLRLLKGYIEEAILVFDADEAGRSAAARCLPLFMSADLEARVLQLPDGHDPDTFVREFGPESLRGIIGRATPLLDYYLTRTKAKYPATLSGKSRVIQDVLSVAAQVETETRKDILLRAASERLGVSERALRLSVSRQYRSGREDASDTARDEDLVPDFECGVIGLMLSHPHIAPEIFAARIGPLIQDERNLRIYETMARAFATYGKIEPDRLLEQLDGDDSDMVTRWVFETQFFSRDNVAQMAHDYIQRFAERAKRSKGSDLSQRIKLAQQQGDTDALLALLAQKNQLIKESNK